MESGETVDDGALPQVPSHRNSTATTDAADLVEASHAPNDDRATKDDVAKVQRSVDDLRALVAAFIAAQPTQPTQLPQPSAQPSQPAQTPRENRSGAPTPESGPAPPTQAAPTAGNLLSPHGLPPRHRASVSRAASMLPPGVEPRTLNTVRSMRSPGGRLRTRYAPGPFHQPTLAINSSTQSLGEVASDPLHTPMSGTGHVMMQHLLSRSLTPPSPRVGVAMPVSVPVPVATNGEAEQQAQAESFSRQNTFSDAFGPDHKTSGDWSQGGDSLANRPPSGLLRPPNAAATAAPSPLIVAPRRSRLVSFSDWTTVLGAGGDLLGNRQQESSGRSFPFEDERSPSLGRGLADQVRFNVEVADSDTNSDDGTPRHIRARAQAGQGAPTARRGTTHSIPFAGLSITGRGQDSTLDPVEEAGIFKQWDQSLPFWKSGIAESSVVCTALDGLFVLAALLLCSSALLTVATDEELHVDGSVRVYVAVVNTVCTLFTLLWVGVRFFVHVRASEWEVIDDPPSIAAIYARTWLAFDLFYALPVELIFIGWLPVVYYAMQFRHVLRFARIAYLGRSSNPLSPVRRWFVFSSFIAVGAVIFASAGAAFTVIENSSALDGLYWAVITMTGVGYGDVTPSSGTSSRLLGIAASFTGVLVIATATAFATSFITTRDKLEEQLDQKKQMMHSMLQYYDIPWGVQREVIAMFPAVLNSQSEAEFKSMTEGMPRFIAAKIEGYARAKILRGVPLFQRISSAEIVLDLARRLQLHFAAPQEYIVQAGDIGRDMYFLVRGVTEVLVPQFPGAVEEVVVASLRTGQYFGEIALIEDTVRTASVQAVTLCELLVLTKEDFGEVTTKHQTLRTMFAKEGEARRKQTLAATTLGAQAAGTDDEQTEEIDEPRPNCKVDGGGGMDMLGVPNPLQAHGSSLSTAQAGERWAAQADGSGTSSEKEDEKEHDRAALVSPSTRVFSDTSEH